MSGLNSATMSHTYRVAFVLTMILATMLGASAESAGAQELPAGVGIVRFSVLDEGVYRGGQPNEEGFLYLKDLGIKTIVNLRAEDNESDKVRDLGMSYFHIPIRLIFPWSKISNASIEKYFEVVNNPDNYP